MKKRRKTISLVIALVSLAAMSAVVVNGFDLPINLGNLSFINLREPLEPREVVDEQPANDGEILRIDYNKERDILKLDYAGGGSDLLSLELAALEIETFELQNPGMPLYLRFFSPAFYESYGQPGQGIIILTRINPADIRGDPANNIAVGFPVAKESTAADLSFAMLHNYFENHNKVDTERLICSSADPEDLLSGVASSSCYVVCQGKAEIAAKFLTASTRLVPMFSQREDLDDAILFLWSELHTTIEIYDNNKWYVADPTYGFAYVKDASGQRIDTRGLITALAKQNAGELTFGLVNNGLIYEVPGDVMVDTNTAMAAIYYTPDKRLEYQVVREEPPAFRK